MRVVPRGIISILATVVTVWSAAMASAQTPTCQFLAGFADISTPLGAEVVGACTENERFLCGGLASCP